MSKMMDDMIIKGEIITPLEEAQFNYWVHNQYIFVSTHISKV